MRWLTRSTRLAAPTAMCLALMLAAPGPAQAHTVTGSPQPELKPFTIGHSTSDGTVALVDGKFVTAYDVSDSKIRVCVIARGARSCPHPVTLDITNSAQNDASGVPQVIPLGGKSFDILQQACCDSDPSGSDQLFRSLDGGSTFAYVGRVGTLGVTTSTFASGHIVFAGEDDTNGGQVNSISAATPTSPTSTATFPGDGYDVGLATYHGGVLFATDAAAQTDYTSHVYYAPAGDANAFGSTASYTRVGTFAHEEVLGISGNALLTVQTGGKELFVLRTFNGSGFGSAHLVPHFEGTSGNWSVIDQDPSGKIHVFNESQQTPYYHLREEATSTGKSWTHLVDHGNAIKNNYFSAALDSHGTGLVLGSQHDEIGYPVLRAQSVSFALTHSSVKAGHSTPAEGHVRLVDAGATVTLEKLASHGKWKTVTTTREDSKGKFNFTVDGGHSGSAAYRVMVDDKAGYWEYGYSKARRLRVSH